MYLTEPNGENVAETTSAPVNCVISHRFVVTNQEYEAQYASLYYWRLAAMKTHVLAALKDSKIKVYPQLKDATLNEQAVTIGTLYKHMKLKPSVLADYMGKMAKGDENLRFTDPSDSLFLEDESGRLLLSGCIDPDEVVTGMVVGVKGCLSDTGLFSVAEVIYPKAPEVPHPLTAVMNPSNRKERARCAVFVSGLGVGNAKTTERRTALVNFLVSANSPVDAALVVLQGNSTITFDPTTTLSALDGFIASIAGSTTVHLLPGDEYHNLPQQPLPKSYLPNSTCYGNVFRVTSPHMFTVDGELKVICLGDICTAEMLSYTQIMDAVEGLSAAFKARSIAPTAPDTLSCYPFNAEDPFTLTKDEDIPHLIVGSVGRQTALAGGGMCECAAKAHENGTLIVALPSFDLTGVVLVVDLENRVAYPQTFSLRP